ncbi:MAG: hypothetical protein ABJC24_05390 [Chloroflexota bacterium]
MAGFHLWVLNRDSARLNTFFMKAVSTAPAVGAYWSRNSEASQACDLTNNEILCTFGALNSGDVLNITAAFTLPTNPSQSEDNCKIAGEGGVGHTGASWRCVDFQFASGSGFVPGKNKSRGDIYHWHDSVRTDGGPDKGAQFPFCRPSTTCDANLLNVFNNLGVSNKNVQSTELTAPTEAFNSIYGSTGLAVADGFLFDCPTGLPTCGSHETTGSSAFVGEWSQADVNSEQHFETAFIRVDISMYGVKPDSIEGVVHLWQDTEDVWHEALPITNFCPSAGGPTDANECIWVSSSGKIVTVSVWLHDNGRIRTF